jgi:hypothetical protein
MLDDKESTDILTMVLGQAGHEFEVLKSLREMTGKCLFISNGKFTFFRYLFVKYSKIFYVIVKDFPSQNSWIARKFYLAAVGELVYPTKMSEVDKCVRAMALLSGMKKVNGK